jgi:threonine dehydrogenase-like Zn-dependent dehydrogenase
VLREATAGRGADCVVEAVGSPAAARLAFDLLRPGGTLAIIGVHNEAALPITPAEAYGKNLTLRTGRCPARRFLEPLLSGIAAGRWPVAELLSHRLPLEAGPEAYRRFAAREAGWIKVVFEA